MSNAEKEKNLSFDQKAALAGLEGRVSYKKVVVVRGERYTVEDIDLHSLFPLVMSKNGDKNRLYQFSADILPHKNA